MDERRIDARGRLDRRRDQHLAIGQHRDARRQRDHRVEVVRNHHDGQPERAVQRPDQLDEFVGGLRVEAGRRLVEEQQLGLERDRARDADALDHPARQRGRHLRRMLARQPDHLELEHHDVMQQVGRHAAEPAQRLRDVVEHRHRREQRALLEQHPRARAHQPRARFVDRRRILAEHLDRARRRPLEAEDLPHQRRLARAGAADDRDDLAAPYVEVELLVDDVAPVALGEVTHLDHELAAGRARCGAGRARAGCRGLRGGMVRRAHPSPTF
ncbi:hypothetical protein BvRS1_28570 [Burkholderia vietnamiensis]|nr:hypothetical protein BvRS1_28570 [Burkholderia vietnamiensis]